MKKIWNSLTEQLRDYCRKHGFKEVVLGLSGGLDSAMVSVLACDALGAENVHCLMMKTKHTSDLSLSIAQELARLNGFDYQVLDIEPIIEAQQQFLTQALGEKPKKVVMENLQARERGKILMAFSNQFNYLVLACGNKSEAATGYCTLYGDTCGGLMPIGDLYKSQIFELARWRNQQGLVLPKAVINRAPSAELSDGQKDEDSLPPYAVLDAILQLYLDEQKTQRDIVAQGYDETTVAWVIKQYARTEFKRKQMPEILKI